MNIFRNLLADSFFVFGSNLAGRHGKGAAAFAAQYYRAEQGIGEGPTGRCYALPTQDEKLTTLPLNDIQWYADQFLAYARTQRDTQFQVTKIGCGLAGYKDDMIAPFFLKAPSNVFVPGRWSLITRQLDRARLLVIGSDDTTAAQIEQTLAESTAAWGRKFEVITTGSGEVNDIARHWTRKNDLPWTPFPPDTDFFKESAESVLSLQLAWYATHVVAYRSPKCAVTASRIDIATAEGLRVCTFDVLDTEQKLTLLG